MIVVKWLIIGKFREVVMIVIDVLIDVIVLERLFLEVVIRVLDFIFWDNCLL